MGATATGDAFYGPNATSLARELHLSRPHRVTVQRRAMLDVTSTMRRALPREGVGLLAGRRHGPLIAFDWFVELTNTSVRTDRFAVDPLQFLRAMASLPAGLSPIGFAHSHPAGGVDLSAVDQAELWPQHVHLVVDLLDAWPRIGCWWLDERGFISLPMDYACP